MVLSQGTREVALQCLGCPFLWQRMFDNSKGRRSGKKMNGTAVRRAFLFFRTQQGVHEKEERSIT